jgi:hypothetical protein
MTYQNPKLPFALQRDDARCKNLCYLIEFSEKPGDILRLGTSAVSQKCKPKLAFIGRLQRVVELVGKILSAACRPPFCIVAHNARAAS